MKLESRLGPLYAHRFPEPERRAKGELWRVFYDTTLSRYIDSESTVLDLGAGFGNFINNAIARRRIAIDLNPDTPVYLAAGIEFHQLSLEDLGSCIGEGTIDVAFASNIFEHLRSPEVLLDVLTAVRRVLSPAGTLIILQPNVRLVGGRFWDFFDHSLPLTEKGMSEALRISGFEIAECRAGFLPYTTRMRIPLWAWLLRLYLLLPPAQWLFGKQMFIVAKRSDAF